MLKALEQYPDQVRAVIAQDIVDIMLLPASNKASYHKVLQKPGIRP